MPTPGCRGSIALALCLVALSVPPAAAGPNHGWSSSGVLALELRWFPQAPAFADQFEGTQASVVLEPGFDWRSAGGRHRIEISGFGRYDDRDDERSHVDLREGAYRFVGDRVELVAGVSRVFWGVTESRHLVDVINQVDFVEDVDEEDRLGQPMVRLALDREWGRLELFSLLGFRERTFPGPEGRLRPPLPVESGQALYESSAADGRVDWALRWSHFLGSWDLGLHLFRGTGREPILLAAGGPQSMDRGESPTPSGVMAAPAPAAAHDQRLVPLYQIVSQAGIDVQTTRGAWLWKLEALARRGQGATFGAAVAGLERTLYQIGGSAADLGLLVELLWDDRDATAPPTIYDNDTFLGLRLALNDAHSSELLAGAVVDNDDQSIFGVLEGGRRFGSHFTLELEARVFSSADPLGDLAALDRDSFLNLSAAWHW